MKANIRLNARERAAMNKEISRQCAVQTDIHRDEITARVMWVLHDIFGFGKDRLERFYFEFDKSIDDLIERYELGDSDDAWLCNKKLKDELGIDISELRNRRNSK